MYEQESRGATEANPTSTPAAADGRTLSVVIALLTYLRPDDLKDTLPRLVEQTTQVDADVSILVVDNDPAGGAMPMADDFAGDPVRFVHEPTPGISAARNRALAEASNNRLLVFIDDDERPQEGWLSNLIDTWEQGHPTAVVGPVISTYPPDPDPWIIAGGFFDRRRLRTGTSTDTAATNNLLLDMDQIRAMGVTFDHRFGITGGSDTMFSRELVARGGSIVWCDEAVVVDVVPPERMTREWVLRRRFRMGNGVSRVALTLEKSATGRLRTRMRLTAHGLARVVLGSAQYALGTVIRSIRHQAHGARRVARGSGVVTGAWGMTYSEYKRGS